VIAALVLSFGVSTALGILLLRWVWPAEIAPCPRPLGAALGTGLGAGVSAALLFPWLALFGPTRAFPLVEVGLLALVAVAGRRYHPAPALRAAGRGDRLHGPLRLLTPAFLVALAAAAAAFVTMLRQEPHGEWDAWMNWDMRARMIFLGGATWRTAFSPALPWSHPDYPVLVPSLVVRAWLYAGTATLAGPALVAATFAFGTVALLVSGLAALRRPSQGLLAGMVLLGTPFFIRHAASLYADVPLSFFFLATVVCLALDDRHGSDTRRFAMLAGLAAGLAMWTKNEGLLFTLSVATGILVAGRVAGWPATRRRLGAFGIGLLPGLALVVSFKIAIAPPNDLLSTLAIDRTLGRITAPDRYAMVLRAYAVHLLTFGANGLGGAVWPLAACFTALGVSRPELRRPWALAVAVALVLLLAGHFMVFVSMADELARLLKSSLDRLLLQLWPSALFLGFMLARTPEELGEAEAMIVDHPQHHATLR
jgi:hypothetical protein